MAGDGPTTSGFHPEPGRPVELLAVANRPIVEHAVAALGVAGAVAVVVAARQPLLDVLREVLRDGSAVEVPVGYVEPLGGGICCALAAAADRLEGETVLVQRADGLAGSGLSAAACLVAAGGVDAVLLVHETMLGAGGLEDRRLLRVALAGVPNDDRRLAPAAALALSPAAVRAAAARPGEPISEVFEAVVSGGGRVTTADACGWHRYGGRADDLLELNRIALERLELTPAAARTGSRLHGRVVIHPTARVEASLIRGPAIIGANARVRDAYVGPYTAIGEGVHLEGAEVEHSIVLAGARILHIERRIEGSVIGRDAKVFRDFSLPRALRLHVGDRGEVCLC